VPTPAGPSKQPQSNRLRTVVLPIVIIVLLLMVARVVSGGGGTAKQASGKTFTKDNYAELATDPGSFKGASVDVVGRVLKNPEVKNNETSFQMFADPENSDWNTLVHTDAPPSGLTRSDYVRVKGTVQGARTGQNAFGADIKATEVKADSVSITKSGK
jgi:hypothetical protein